MTSLQYDEYLFELVNDSVMTRTMDGMINFWNRSAEKLYGWRKEEAIGRVSHELLRTQFPKPLKEIESELVRNGLWEGRLVHTTRDGRRVVVESRWTLELKGQSGALLVEINTRSADWELHTDEITTKHKQPQSLLERTVIPLHPEEYFFELVNDSVMTRTMDGRIEFWNRSAEELYGWRKEEAVGRVSHNLLQTRFPKPLEEIESELLRNGLWEGRLVHSTRDGRRVVVKSRWILELETQSGALVEINMRSTDGELDPGARADTDSVEIGSKLMKADDRLVKVVNFILVGGAFLCIIAVLYGLFGHDLIKAIYDGKFLDIGKRLMEGKDVTPLQNYFRKADEHFLGSVLWFTASYLLVLLLIKKPVGTLVAVISFLSTTFVLFCVLEAFPSLIRPLHLDFIPYYVFKAYYIPDPDLGYRGKPLISFTTRSSREGEYLRQYGIEQYGIEMQRISRTHDENGFRNSSNPSVSEIVVTGDSFMEIGDDDADTFPQRLEKHLPGLRVTNLAKGGYGPPHYLQVLKRYGLQKHPKYAFFAFYAGNDLSDTKAYSEWKRGIVQKENMYTVGRGTFFERYHTALSDFFICLEDAIRTHASLLFDKIRLTGGYEYIDRRVAFLDMASSSHLGMLFKDLNDTRSTEQILTSDEGKDLESILSEFRDVCTRNGVKPIVIYVPTAMALYAKYSSDRSGTEWLAVRGQQIAASKNTENAIISLSQQLNISLINLSPLFERAAQRGEIVYYQGDSHWTAAAREMAAVYVAQAIRSTSDSPSRPLPDERTPFQSRSPQLKNPGDVDKLAGTPLD